MRTGLDSRTPKTCLKQRHTSRSVKGQPTRLQCSLSTRCSVVLPAFPLPVALTVNLLEAPVEIHDPLECSVVDLERLALGGLQRDGFAEIFADGIGPTAVRMKHQKNGGESATWCKCQRDAHAQQYKDGGVQHWTPTPRNMDSPRMIKLFYESASGETQKRQTCINHSRGRYWAN